MEMLDWSKTIRNKYWGWRINNIKEIAEKKYRLNLPEYKNIIPAYSQIKFIKSQKFYQAIIIILTALLIYITWKNK